MASNIDLVNEADAFPYDTHNPDVYHFRVLNVPATLGYVLSPVVEALRHLPHWQVDDATRIVMLNSGNDASERTFPIYGPNKEVLLTIERCGSPLFGIVAYGVHARAYVLSESSNGSVQMKIWVPRRARTKQTYAGMLDSTAAGGLAVGEIVLEALVRECEEEAALPPSLVRKLAKLAGMVTNFCVRGDRAGGKTRFLQLECHYVYDLPLSPELICKTNDDEVEEFNLRTVGEIQNALANREFKPNCAIVMLDFFIRHGILTPENEKDYVEIVSRLHRQLQFPTR